MEKLIVLKGRTKNTAAIVLLFFTAVILSSCGGASPEEEYEQLLAQKETFPVEILQVTPEGDTLFKVPNSLINDCYLNGKRDYCLILRKVMKEDKTYLQFVRAEIVAWNDTYQTVKKLKAGDEFLAAPQKLLPELAHFNKLETRKRFLRVFRY